MPCVRKRSRSSTQKRTFANPSRNWFPRFLMEWTFPSTSASGSLETGDGIVRRPRTQSKKFFVTVSNSERQPHLLIWSHFTNSEREFHDPRVLHDRTTKGTLLTAMTKQLSVNIFNSACTFFFRLQGDGLHICHYISWGNLFCHACMQYGSSSAMWMSPSNSAAAASPYQQRHFIVPSKRLPLYRQPPSQSGFPHRWQRPIRVGRLQRQYSVWIHDVTTVDARRQEQRRSFHDHQAQ